MNSSIVVIGSLNVDFVLNVERFPAPGETVAGREFKVFPGGKGANQAFAAARLGGQVSMIGRVGNDAHADWLRNNLASAGVDVSAVSCDPDVSSGIASITIDAPGQNQIIIVPGANGRFGVEGLEPFRDLIASAKFVLLQLEIPLETVAAAASLAKRGGATVILDPAPALPIPEALLAAADYLTPNEIELAQLAGVPPCDITRENAERSARSLLAQGAKKVLVKLGAQGAMLVGGDYEHFWPAFAVHAVDTTAAGDAFNGAFAVALAEGKSEIEAGWFAAAAAACSVTKTGAQPSLPTRAAVDAMLAAQKPIRVH